MQFEDFGSNRQTLPVSPAAAGSAQPELDRENARLKYLIANTPAIIYSSVPTGDGTMTFVSDNVSRVLDYRPEDMVADPSFWFDHIHPDDVPTIFSSFALIFTEGQPNCCNPKKWPPSASWRPALRMRSTTRLALSTPTWGRSRAM